jgi:hypothetical protein
MAFLRDEHGRLIRKDGSLVERAVVRRGPRAAELGGGRVSHLRVDAILGGSGELRDAYEKLLDDPSTLLKDLAAFLRERGHHVNLSAVRRHRRRYHAEFRSLREAAKMAQAFCAVTRREGAGAVVEAAQGRFEMLLMQDLFKMRDNPQLAPDEWQRWARAVTNAVATRRSVEEMRAEFERKAAEAAEAFDALDPTESTRRVVERVKEILGV